MNFPLLTAGFVSAAAASRSFTFSEKAFTFDNESVYQAGYDGTTGSVILTSATKTDSNIIKFDIDSFKPVEYVNPDSINGTMFSTYGLKVDQNTGNVWVTNGKQSSIAAYKTSDLSLVKQLPAKALSGPARDLSFYGSNVYAGAEAGMIDVFSTESYEKVDTINVTSHGQFGIVMQSVVDQDAGVLYTVSYSPAKAAAIDLKNDNSVTLYDLSDDIKISSGVALDAKRNHLFVVGQGTNASVVLDTKSGNVIKKIETGATGLNAIYEPVNDLVYYASRTQGVTVVIDAESLEVVDKLESGSNSNQVDVGPDGTVFVVNHDRQPPSKLHAYTPKLVKNASSASSAASAPATKVSSAVNSGVVTSPAAKNATSSGSAASEAVATANVTYFTTYCPSPTTFTHGSSTYTVTEATTLSIEECDCTKTAASSSPVNATLGASSSAPVTAAESTSAPAVANAANILSLGASTILGAILVQLI